MKERAYGIAYSTQWFFAALVKPVHGERDAKAFQSAHATDYFVRYVRFRRNHAIVECVLIIIAGE
jgi:hypothetical protein